MNLLAYGREQQFCLTDTRHVWIQTILYFCSIEYTSMEDIKSNPATTKNDVSCPWHLQFVVQVLNIRHEAESLISCHRNVTFLHRWSEVAKWSRQLPSPRTPCADPFLPPRNILYCSKFLADVVTTIANGWVWNSCYGSFSRCSVHDLETAIRRMR